ncbi:MAG TPA: Smr/MutS family protein, partial [Gemmatimonadales bacterium]|nr:Smr/MutS family protein [Gemmatimonadales bacterium]
DALDTIEFGAVLELVAARAAGPLGAERVRRRRPTTDTGWIARELARVEQVAVLFRRRDGLLTEPVDDVAPALARLRIEGSLLDGHELAALRRLIATARRVADDLGRVREQAPLTLSLCAEPLPRGIERRLELSVDDDGQLLDTASPALSAARREVHAARARLVKRLESILHSLDPAGGAEGSVTLRQGRYVIPVRRDLRARPEGIIHDESASAGTLFIEPSAAVELGNDFREAQVAEERETLVVLRELTNLLRPVRPDLLAAFEMCIAVDDLVARARWAAELDAHAPLMAPAPSELRILRGRHPLLLAQEQAVIPFDLRMDASERTLLVSGPNTGGKTVLLKAVALFSALAQSGIVPPVAEESRLPVFSRLAADIGDRQSIAASLSTFSAHVRTLGAILHQADSATLVLLDEIGSGTDPAEGAALAAASVTQLTRRGALTLATTHLGKLKTLAHEEPGVVNASLQFDAATLTPTYHFQKGIPGRSYGLAIARRLGLAPDVLASAEQRVPDAERSFDALLASVEERQRDVERRELELAEREGIAAELNDRLSAREARDLARATELDRRERDADRRARREAREHLLAARRTVEEALAAARGAVDEERAREARRVLEDEIRAQGTLLAADEEASALLTGADGAGLTVGDAVVTTAGVRGTLLELRTDARAVIAAGAMRMVVPIEGLTRDARRGARAEAPRSPDGPTVTAPMEIDLRGMTGDEAEAATLAALDAAILAEHPLLRIIHGMGTGVVRERVRRTVKRDRR